ncbi:nol1 nop2 sun family protein [Plasmopara halstedii]|uniref:Nol1 nop2 sun family protein n=1 Tax=Plasmopara halstedii TaxID=4781 RepID=A0A0P1AQW2_PLAHL|nr:nol1 nop2 sun family protein [Plasmopara halstedii]CEG43288.1 nol1 nop2 sun family protein [Plasmopara halstedii]|eukprot:XP_024579657.1 nol1 nop2 sun family protein [Plasmopara halstedii]
MGGRSRATLRRVKKKRQQENGSVNTKDGSNSLNSRKSRHDHHKTLYDSNSDSSDEGTQAVAIPLPSLEDNHGVLDLVHQLETQSNSSSKRARTELEKHVVEQRKKRFREEKAEKIVWRKFDRENLAFKQFYERILGLEKNEFERFLACLKEPLPVYMRINGNYSSLSEIVTGSLELDFNLKNVTVPTPVGGGELHMCFRPESWVPGKRLWKLSVDSKLFRKVETLRSLSTYVRMQGSLGMLLRQDPAATVLSAFLDVQPGQRVLDLCGGGEHRAPILEEYLFSGRQANAGFRDILSARNVLVINERDATAAASTARNLTRTIPLARDLIVTGHKPEEFPTSKSANALFDRVICCAPCSGDGLIRKFPERWRTWSPNESLAYHPDQVRVAEHAATLLRIGGSMLYSTRSLNPIENEAVVAELLRRSKGALKLLVTENVLKELRRSNGLTKWSVLDLASWDDAPESQRHRLRPSMWPPSDEECNDMHLDRCVRILPHQNDTHGLFLAVFQKVHEINTQVAGPAPLLQSMKKTKANGNKEKTQTKAKKPFGSFTKIDQHHVASIQSFYALESNPVLLERVGMARQKRAVHLVTPAVAELLTNQLQGRLSIYHAGVYAMRPAAGRDCVADELTDNGAHALLPEMKGRILSLPQEKFTSFLKAREIWLKNAGDHACEQLANMTEGSVVIVLDEMEPAQTRDQDILLVAVKRHNSCSIVSSPASIARVKSLLEEFANTGDGEDGYDSLEFEND